jgi:hypothetical protein
LSTTEDWQTIEVVKRDKNNWDLVSKKRVGTISKQVFHVIPYGDQEYYQAQVFHFCDSQGRRTKDFHTFDEAVDYIRSTVAEALRLPVKI